MTSPIGYFKSSDPHKWIVHHGSLDTVITQCYITAPDLLETLDTAYKLAFFQGCSEDYFNTSSFTLYKNLLSTLHLKFTWMDDRWYVDVTRLDAGLAPLGDKQVLIIKLPKFEDPWVLITWILNELTPSQLKLEVWPKRDFYRYGVHYGEIVPDFIDGDI